MSLIKYIPQIKHNYERKTMAGFAIESVMLDIIGGIASLSQLFLQLSQSQEGLHLTSFIANFGKISLAIVTLSFNFLFILQWLVYSSNIQKSKLSTTVLVK